MKTYLFTINWTEITKCTGSVDIEAKTYDEALQIASTYAQNYGFPDVEVEHSETVQTAAFLEKSEHCDTVYVWEEKLGKLSTFPTHQFLTLFSGCINSDEAITFKDYIEQTRSLNKSNTIAVYTDKAQMAAHLAADIGRLGAANKSFDKHLTALNRLALME